MYDPSSQRLYEAAHNGDVPTLQEIHRKNPSLLDGSILGVATYDPLLEPPLHVAAFCGRLDFVVRVLELEPGLIHQSDHRGLSPLHMAAAEGHVNVMTHLLQVDPNLCFVCDDINGRSPLHFAAMNGRLQALQVLVQQMQATARRDNVTNFLNAKDNRGFTLLHLAVYNQHFEIVEYLISLEVEVNALNSKGLTPLDMLNGYPTVYRNRVKTANFMRRHGATSSSALTSSTSPEIWTRKKDALMVVASLIATMAFQAAVNPPGGVWQDDGSGSNNNNTSVVSGPQIPGKSIMATTNPTLYTLFITSASAAFMFSLAELGLHMSNTISNNGWVSEILFVYAKYISTMSLVAAYSISVAFLTTLPGREATALGIMLCILMVPIVWFLVYALRQGFAGRHSALRTLIQIPPPT